MIASRLLIDFQPDWEKILVAQKEMMVSLLVAQSKHQCWAQYLKTRKTQYYVSSLTFSLLNSESTSSQLFEVKCISGVARIGSTV